MSTHTVDSKPVYDGLNPAPRRMAGFVAGLRQFGWGLCHSLSDAPPKDTGGGYFVRTRLTL